MEESPGGRLRRIHQRKKKRLIGRSLYKYEANEGERKRRPSHRGKKTGKLLKRKKGGWNGTADRGTRNHDERVPRIGARAGGKKSWRRIKGGDRREVK